MLGDGFGPLARRDGFAAVGGNPGLLAGIRVRDPFPLCPLLSRVASFLLGNLGLALDVNAPAGQPGRQARVLTLAADRQRQLVIGYDHLGNTLFGMKANFPHPGRGQRLRHEVMEVVGERDDVDLLASQLVHDLTHPAAAGTHARTDWINVGVIRPDGDLGAVAGLARTGLQFDDAIGDLGDFQLEQLADQSWMRARHDDLRTLGGLAHLHDVRLEAAVGLWPLVGNLLGLGQQRLHTSQIEQRVTGIVLLDDAGDDVALAPRVFVVLHVAFDFADALVQDLPNGLGHDPAQVVRRVIPFAHNVAQFIDFLGVHRDVERLVDDDVGLLGGTLAALVGRFETVRDRLEQDLGGHALLGSECLERFHDLRAVHRPCLPRPLFGGEPHSNVVRALAMSPNGTDSV